jgi:Glu-tRNA(Gln) amidotransferase subunit E-like FAD-binding protein
LYEAAMLEVDDTKMSQRISAARHAILDRAEEVLTGSPTDERGALNDALQALRVLERAVSKDSRLM